MTGGVEVLMLTSNSNEEYSFYFSFHSIQELLNALKLSEESENLSCYRVPSMPVLCLYKKQQYQRAREVFAILFTLLKPHIIENSRDMINTKPS